MKNKSTQFGENLNILYMNLNDCKSEIDLKERIKRSDLN